MHDANTLLKKPLITAYYPLKTPERYEENMEECNELIRSSQKHEQLIGYYWKAYLYMAKEAYKDAIDVLFYAIPLAPQHCHFLIPCSLIFGVYKEN